MCPHTRSFFSSAMIRFQPMIITQVLSFIHLTYERFVSYFKFSCLLCIYKLLNLHIDILYVYIYLTKETRKRKKTENSFFFVVFIFISDQRKKRQKKKERKKIKVHDNLVKQLMIPCQACSLMISLNDDDDGDIVVDVAFVDEENNWENQCENVHLNLNSSLNPMVHELLLLLVHCLSNRDHLMNCHHYVKDLCRLFF